MAAFAIDLLGTFEERHTVLYKNQNLLVISTFTEPRAAFVASNSKNELV